MSLGDPFLQSCKVPLLGSSTHDQQALFAPTLPAAFRQAEEADRRLAELGPKVEAALCEARKATTELKNQHEEISTADLHLLADTLLTQWSQEARPDSLQVGLGVSRAQVPWPVIFDNTRKVLFLDLHAVSK